MSITAWPRRFPSDIDDLIKPHRNADEPSHRASPFTTAAIPLVALVYLASASDEAGATPNDAATVLKAPKSCFDATIEASGIVNPARGDRSPPRPSLHSAPAHNPLYTPATIR
jgi:hypothetical protein